MTEVHGHYDAKFEPLVEQFLNNFTEKGDVGASYAASLEGEMVVDIWAGHRDAAATEPWQEDTIVNVYSTTKTMAAACALVLADRGLIDFNAPVSDYWPEFAQNGKAHVEVRHFMSHSAGLSGMDEPAKGDAFYDWDFVVDALAKQAPWWEPGAASGYHALTQGHLIGEVVRRVTGRSLGTFFAEEIAGPLGADFHIGTAEEHWPRVGELIPPENSLATQTGEDKDSIAAKTFRNPVADAKASGTPGWRLAEIPAANGHGNARSVVRAQTPMANGGKAFGVELLSEQGAARIMDEQISGKDLVLGVPMRFGMGYGLTAEAMPMGPNDNIAYWGGWGGSTIVVDQDAHLCVSYVMNKMFPGVLGDTRGYALLQKTYNCL
ncbi:MAG: CubicO group peptidase (beta-lactamase class C family) [Limisphaerales bacterium]|jgi:CubicO group peptidase (beta-lactamase class C family)